MTDVGFVAAVAAMLAFFAYRAFVHFRTEPSGSYASKPTKSQVLEGHHPDGRKFGRWDPVNFDYPKFQPQLEYSLTDTNPPAYRAFRYKQSKMTMGIMSYPPEAWIQLDNNWKAYQEHRSNKMRQLGENIGYGTMPGYEAVAWEVCQEIAEFVSRKYPHIYTVTRYDNNQGWYGEGEIMTIGIPAFDAHYDLRTDHPIFVAGSIQPSDINCMVEANDGEYYLRCATTVTGGSVRLQDKIGKSLSAIHINGHVPHYRRDLEKSMNRYFAKAQPGKDIVRNNFTFSLDNNLSWSEKLRGPFEDFDVVTRKPKVGSKSFETWVDPKPATKAEDIYLRQERQILRRLPKTGGMLFMAHAYLNHIPSLMDEPGVPGRMASVLRSWPPEIIKQKSAHMYIDCLIPYLEEQHQRQLREGICEEGQLPQNFPFN